MTYVLFGNDFIGFFKHSFNMFKLKTYSFFGSVLMFCDYLNFICQRHLSNGYFNLEIGHFCIIKVGM